jgi:hypothetical protein
MSSARPLAAVCVAAALALWASLDFYGVMGRTRQDPYKVAEFLQRVAPAVPMLPTSALAGYLSDATLDDVKGQVLYFTSLHAVAPRKLLYLSKPDPAMEWVLGNFSVLGWRSFAEAHDLEIFKDLGNGLAVLRRK